MGSSHRAEYRVIEWGVALPFHNIEIDINQSQTSKIEIRRGRPQSHIRMEAPGFPAERQNYNNVLSTTAG